MPLIYRGGRSGRMGSRAVVLVLVLFVTSSGCASMCYPGRTYVCNNRRGDVDWVMVLLNLPWDLITFGHATAIDMGTGAYWKTLPVGWVRTEDGRIVEEKTR